MNEQENRFADVLNKAEAYAIQYLEHGREGWDIPHTRAVVFYAEELGLAEGQDILIMKTAGWFHDAGYFGLFKGDHAPSHSSIRERKSAHMIEGAKITSEFLDRPDVRVAYTPRQRERTVHIVSVHDKVKELREVDELIFMEADTLGQIDVTRVTHTFDYENGMRYLEGVKEHRLPYFISTLGKNYANELIPKLEAYYESIK